MIVSGEKRHFQTVHTWQGVGRFAFRGCFKLHGPIEHSFLLPRSGCAPACGTTAA
mgnify:CR=1 FL=1